MPLTAETFAALVTEDTDGLWEIHRAKLREKPAMSFGHNEAQSLLAAQLVVQTSGMNFRVRQNAAHVMIANGDSYIPDVAIIPLRLTETFRTNPRQFEVYAEPLPFVAEIWSPSTGNYDVDAKIPGYRSRGDSEIWRIHPFDRTVSIWRRQADGSYKESEVRTGRVELSAISGVSIDIDQLFGDPARS